MSSLRRNRITVIVAALHLMIVAAAAYAFAIVNPLGTHTQKGAAISAANYAVDNITYTLDARQSQLIDQVNFTLSPISIVSPNTTVQAKLLAASTTYFPCRNISPTAGTWQCTFTGVTVAAADQLDVRVLPLQLQGPYGVWLPLTLGRESFNTYLPVYSVGQYR